MEAWQKDDEETRRGAPEWLVTYADFMTLLLAFFVMIVSVSDINLHDGRFDSLKSSFGNHFGADHTTAEQAANATVPRNAPLAKWINRSLDERRRWLTADGRDESANALSASLQVALRYENREVALNTAHVAELTRRAAGWKTSGQQFEIVGYIEPRELTDSDDFSKRLERAQQRCAKMQLWLVEQGGITPENIRLSIVPASARREPAAAGLPAQLDLFAGAASTAPAAAVGTSRIGDLRFTNGGYASPVR